MYDGCWVIVIVYCQGRHDHHENVARYQDQEVRDLLSEGHDGDWSRLLHWRVALLLGLFRCHCVLCWTCYVDDAADVSSCQLWPSVDSAEGR